MLLVVLGAPVGIPFFVGRLPRQSRLRNILNIDANRAGETSQPATYPRFLAVLVGSDFPTGHRLFDSVRHIVGLSWSLQRSPRG